MLCAERQFINKMAYKIKSKKGLKFADKYTKAYDKFKKLHKEGYKRHMVKKKVTFSA